MKRREFITVARRRGAAWPLARARAAGRADAAHRCAHASSPRTIRRAGPCRRRSCRACKILGWADRSQCADRCPLGRGEVAERYRTIRGGTGRARAGRSSSPAATAPVEAVQRANPHHPDRVCGGDRSGRRRFGRQPGAAGRQRHRLHAVRIQPEREMAGAAEGDRAERHASGSASGSACRTGIGQFAAIQAMAPSLGVEVNPSTCATPARSSAPSRLSRVTVEWRSARDARAHFAANSLRLSLRWRPGTSCRRFSRFATSSPAAACSPMALT